MFSNIMTTTVFDNEFLYCYKTNDLVVNALQKPEIVHVKDRIVKEILVHDFDSFALFMYRRIKFHMKYFNCIYI